MKAPLAATLACLAALAGPCAPAARAQCTPATLDGDGAAPAGVMHAGLMTRSAHPAHAAQAPAGPPDAAAALTPAGGPPATRGASSDTAYLPLAGLALMAAIALRRHGGGR